MLLLPLIITAIATILDTWRYVIKSHWECKYWCEWCASDLSYQFVR